MNIKKGLSILISAVMVFSPIMSVHAYDTDGEKKVIESPAVSDNDISEDKAVITHEVPKVKASSGTCGDDLTWTLDDSGTLTISGTGDMIDYWDLVKAPWYDNCLNIKTVVIKDGVTSVGNRAFNYSYNLESVTIPNSVTSIGDSAFSGCHALTTVTIPDGVTDIGIGAFSGCIGLTSVTIPDSVTSIGGYVFDYCLSLTQIVIHKNIINIGECAFSSTPSLMSITVDENNPCYSSDEYGVLFNKDKTTLIRYPSSNEITSYTVPSSVTSIERDSFADSLCLKYVTMPDNVTSIGDDAFENCSSLTSFTIPKGVTSIDDRVFDNCSSLTSVTIPDSVTSIGECAFRNCSNLTSVTIPYGVADIGWSAFCDCTSLTSVTIPNSVKSIDDYAFGGCTSLTSVTIADSVTSMGDGIFSDCRSLISVIMGDGVTRIGYDVFRKCTSLTSMTIGNSVESIDDYAFFGCTSLTSVTIPDSVTTIGLEAFYDCESLESVYITSIESWYNISFNDSFSNPFWYAENLYLNGELVTNLVLPDGITTVRSDPFSGIKSIKSLVIPEGIVSIQKTAFTGDSNIETVILPKSLVNIDYCAFSVCSSIKKVYYAGSEAEWNEIVIDEGNDCLKNAEIVFGVITDDEGESDDNSHGAHLAMGTLGTSQWVLFEDGAVIVNGTGALEFADIPFYKYRDMITSVKISDGITSIPEDMFYKCEKITKVIIPKSVTSIGDSAFWRCSGITAVYYGGTAEEWNNITIGDYNDALFGAEFKYNYSAVTEVGIKFLANPPKDAYVYGEELALDDTIVVKKYSDGSFTEIEDYTVTGYDKYTFGTQDVSITHDGHTIDLVVSVKPTEANSLTVPVTAGMTVEEFSAQYSDHYTVLVFDNDKETLLLEDDVMRSGCVVQFVRDGSVVDSVAINVGGDATGDGVVNGKDLIRIKKQILEGNAVEYTEFADVNRDGVVDEADLDALVNMVL